MEMKEIDLTKCVNCRFRAKIDGKEIEGRIAVDGDYLRFFYSNGDIYSIYIPCYWEHGKVDYFDDFEIVPRDPETYRDWQVGDSATVPNEKRNDSAYKEIIFRSGELVICKDGNGDISGGYTCGQLHRLGYRLVLTDIERQIIEERKKYEPQDGDIVAWKDKDDDGDVAITIYRGNHRGYFTLFTSGKSMGDNKYDSTLDMNIFRPATEDEKQRLFDAMAKEGMRWNAEKKVVEDIPKSHEFKKGEPVLARDYDNELWALYAYHGQAGDKHIVKKCFQTVLQSQCIPYNESTMHLLGTSEDYKEGE